jgi:uncharacterized protein YbcV (DUF1398 family)
MTDTIANIEQLLQESKTNKWPYPKTFDTLKALGVTSYTISFADKYSAIYSGSFGTYQEKTPPGYHAMHIADTFSADDVKIAIMRNMQKITNYIEFLEEIAKAGSSHYTVDMASRSIKYFNNDESQFNQENVPVWK